MQRFVLQQNITRYRGLLNAEQDPLRRARVGDLLSRMRRELTLLEAAEQGALPSLGPARRAQPSRNAAAFLSAFERAESCYLLLDPGPGLHIVDMTDSYAAATMIDRRTAAGRPLFEIFPDNPGDRNADGASNLYASLRMVVEIGKPHAMAVQRYDVRDENGAFVERYWQPINRPVFDDLGRLLHLLHQVEDVTEDVTSAAAAVGSA